MLEYGYGGLQHPGVRMGAMGKAQVVKNKKGLCLLCRSVFGVLIYS